MKRLLFMTVALTALVLAGGCGKKEAAKEEAPKPEEPRKLSLSDLFDADKPGLVGPFAKLKFGASVEDAKAAFPKWFEETDTYGRREVARGELEGYELDISGRLEFEGGLATVSMDLPKEKAIELLKEKWGDPRQLELGRDDVHMWHDETAGVRAVLKPTFSDDTVELAIEGYLSFAALAGKGLEFQPGAVLGKTGAELLKAFPQYVSAKKDSESSTRPPMR